MASINHCIGLQVEKADLLAALTTTDGLAQWWTHDVQGSCQENEIIEFYFNEHRTDMRVLESNAENILWECVSGPEEWLGTTLQFEFINEENETLLMFQHDGWASETPFHHHCSMKWAVFMLSLKNYLEQGVGQPFPNDVHITNSGF